MQHGVHNPGASHVIIGDEISSLFLKLWRRRRCFLLVFILILLPVIGAIVLLPRVYYSSGMVIIGNVEPASGAPAAWQEKLGDPADLQSQLLIAKSPRMLRLVLESPGVVDAIVEDCRQGIGYRLGLTHCSGLKQGDAEALRYLDAHYSVLPAGRSRIISIGYSSPLREAAFILANALLITYLEDQRGENAQAREAASSWLQGSATANSHAALSRSGGLVSGPEGSSHTQKKHDFYKELYSKATDLERERRSLVNPGHLVSFAEFPNYPSFPKPIGMLGGGMAVATALATLLSLWLDATDRTVRRTRDLEALTPEPVLVNFPRIEQPSKSNTLGRLLTTVLQGGEQQQLSASQLEADVAGWGCPSFAAAARTLYARLLLEPDHNAGRCILVASASPGEGKTFTTMAFALAAVEGGWRVLTIDCDLKRADHAAPTNEQTGGLGEILTGRIEPEDAIVKSALERLDIIRAGSAPLDLALLLIDGRLEKLIQWASHYDLILLDGPSGFPPGVGMLARYADGLLWCVRWGQTHISDVSADLAELQKRRLKLLGLAITMVDFRELRYFERKGRHL